MRRVGWMVALLALGGCASSLNGPEVAEYRGLYASGFEVSGFTPCGSEESWWTAGSEELSTRYRATARKEYEPVYVVVRGEVGPEGKYGHMGAYTRELAVHQVLEVRPAREGECR